MSKVTLAFGSFVVGACSTFLFFMLSGNQTSTFAQARGFVDEGAIPVVRPLGGNSMTFDFKGVTQQLDGLECDKCTFENVSLEYSGGAFRIASLSLSGNTRLTLKGAAANTIVLLNFLQSLTNGQRPKAITPKAPITQLASTKAPFMGDLISPF